MSLTVRGGAPVEDPVEGALIRLAGAGCAAPGYGATIPNTVPAARMIRARVMMLPVGISELC